MSDFYADLAKTRHRIKWTRGTKTDGRIRGRIRRGPYAGELCCPLTAIYWSQTGNFETCGYPRDSGQYYRENYDIDAYAVVQEADYSSDTDFRRQILTALGFKP